MKILALEFSSPQRSVAVVERAPQKEPARSVPRDQERSNGVSSLCSTGGEGRGEEAPPNLRFEAGTPVVASWQAVVGRPDPRVADALGLVEAALQGAPCEREAIECVAVGLGPGSYTGIRAAIALAQGWQLARGVRLLGLSSAACVAAQGQAEGVSGRVEVVIDAQRGEFYLAGYEIDAAGWRQAAPLRLAARAEVQERQRAGSLIIGPEVAKWFPEGRVVFPHAAALGRLAAGRSDFVSGDKLEPIYLRETQFVKSR